MTRRISTAALAAMAILCAACERGGGGAGGADAPADTATADSSAMGIARGVLGPQVAMAIPFSIQPRDARFIAAALPVIEWVEDVIRSGNSVAPGGHEMVILELRGGSWAVHKPGLYASRAPFLPQLDDTATAAPADSATLSRVMGVEEVDGDGFAEVWTAHFRPGQREYVWEIRAFNRDRRILYQGEFRGGNDGGGLDSARADFSDAAAQSPAAREWLVRKAEGLDAQYLVERRGATPGTTAAAGTPR
ncbi:MAG TPA: hypothetical protein VFR37_02520 [Longimicrobium sp.]|nr:hypothetical protein [Longimicrobium sp.]